MSEVLYKSRTFSVVEENVTLPNGLSKKLSKIIHPGAVVILPVCEDGSLLVIRQYRPIIKKYIFEFPAGTLEVNEDHLECAKRELAEEAGMQAADWNYLGILYPSPGICDEVQYLYTASNLTPHKLNADEDEIIEVYKKSIDEVKQLILSGDMCDAKSISIFSIMSIGDK